MVDAELSRIITNEELAALVQNIPPNNTALLEHIHPSHHSNPNFGKQANETALVQYIPTEETGLVEYNNLSHPNFGEQSDALAKEKIDNAPPGNTLKA